MTMKVSRVSLSLALLLAPPWSANAQTVNEEASYSQGAALRAQHRDAEALELFRQLHARTSHPRALAQVALAEGAIGRWVDAEAHLTQALAATDPWITRNRATLVTTLGTVRTHVGTLEVICDDATASVWIDGRRAGNVGGPVRVLAGTVSFEVRTEGRAPVVRVATVPSDGIAREEVRLPAAPTPVLAEGTPANGTPVTASATVDFATPPHNTGGLRRTLGWVSIGTGAALAIGGGVAWAIGRGAASAYNDDAICPGVGAPSQPGECASRMSTAQTLEPLAWTGMLFGIAVGITGGVLLGSVPPRTESRAAWRSCSPQVGGVPGIVCQVAF